MSQFAELNNRPDDKVSYDSLAADMKTAYNKRFYNSETNSYGNNTVTANLMLIWMYEDLAGIKNHPDSIGFKKILMAPVFPDGLDFVKASHMTPYGLVSSHWQRNGDSLEWEVIIPSNTSAELIVPSSFKLQLNKGPHKNCQVHEDNGLWKATIGAG